MRTREGAPDLLSIDQVAHRLGLHVRTVRNYVRGGRLKAVRIGKQYRVTKDALEALTAHAGDASSAEPARGPQELPARHVDVSSIAQIEGIDFEAASRITNALLASAKGRGEDANPLRIDTIYDKERARLKVILNGDLSTTASLLKFVNAYLQS